jgi:hypothetical protein
VVLGTRSVCDRRYYPQLHLSPLGHPTMVHEQESRFLERRRHVSRKLLSAVENRGSSSEWWVWSCKPGSWRVPRRGYPLNQAVHADRSRSDFCLSQPCAMVSLSPVRHCSHALFSLLYNVLVMHVAVCPIVNTSCRIAGYSCRRIQQVRVPVQSSWRDLRPGGFTVCGLKGLTLASGAKDLTAATLRRVPIKQLRLPVPFRNLLTVFRVSCYIARAL